MAKVRKYYISISGTARRLLRKYYPLFYNVYGKVLEKMYPVKARNGEEAKKLFKEQYPVVSIFYEIVAEKLEIPFQKVLRAYPAYPAF
ncbi:MAG: hypothetical protein DRN04_18345 [Thermoprotei archaeon]|nr:MAG: hypothetical protein DRN04_18345 [Thermoprotei archaeon]